MENLRVRLLGEVQVEGCDPAALGRRQSRTLLKILALRHGHPVAVDTLADCLWPEEPPARAADQISVLVSRLRALVGADRIRRSDAGYTLTLDWLDVDALGDYAEEADRRLASGAAGGARAAASAGLALIRGGLLADEPDPWWAAAELARAARLVGRLHQTAAVAALAAGDVVEAAARGESALATDPFDEAALCVMMDALARSGRPASALAAYAGFRARLADELGVSPSPETEALHQSILLGTEQQTHLRSHRPDQARPLLPGRADALAHFDALLDLAAAGHGQVSLVEGEAGIGKSTLLGAIRSGAAERGFTVVAVAADELSRTLPIQPLLDVVEALIRHRAGKAVLGPDAGVLGPLLGFQDQPAGSAQLTALIDPGAGQALVLAAVFSVVRRLAEREPLAILIDDLHLADAATRAWLGQAGRRLADARVLIVGAEREEEATLLPGVPTVRLGPLDVSATALVVGPERAAELHSRSGGHPLFLVELAASGAGEALPASIRQAVEGRCARAGPAAITLKTAAVIGPSVDLDLLCEVTGRLPADLLDHLDEGVRRRLLVEEETFGFAHALIRQALADSVGATRTAYIHRQAGRALSRRPDPDPLLVAHHARLGGDRQLASRMLTAAARAAVARFGQEAAAGLLDEAIQLEDNADSRIERARVRSMLMQYAGALSDIDVARAMGAGPEALEAAAWAAHFERHFAEALDLADQGAEQGADVEVRASCLALGGWVSLAAGDIAGAGQRLARAVQEEPGNQLAAAWLGWLRVNQGRPDEAVALIRPSGGAGLAAYRFPDAYALMAATMALGMVGRADEALATLETMSDQLARMGADRWAPRPLNLRGWIVRNLGEPAEADELNLAALADARQLHQVEPLANGLLDLAAGRLMAGDLEQAVVRLGEAASVSTVDHAFRWRHQLRQRLLQARLDLAGGRPEAALAGAESLVAEAAKIGAARCEVQARLVAACANLAAGGPRAEPSQVQILLHRLHLVAGIEAWWITAEVASAFGVPAWDDLARQRVAALLPHAGSYAGALSRAANRRLP